MDALGDDALISAIARGDSAALGALHDRWAPSLLAVAREILRWERDAEECVHDTLLEAWHRARHYSALDGTVRSWLHLRLRSRALQRLRETGGAAARDRQTAAALEAIPGIPGPLAWLPADERAVMELIYLQGRSCPEVAARLGLPIATVQARVAAAIGLLRQRQGDRP